MLYVNPADNRHFAPTPLEGRRANEESKALEEFERLFAYQFIQEMRKSVPESPLFGRSAAGDYFQDMLDDLWAGEMARSEQLGIARDIQSQWRAQEAAKKLLAQAQPAGGISLTPPAQPGIPLFQPNMGIPIENAGSQHDRGIALSSNASPNWFKLRGAPADNPIGLDPGTVSAPQEENL